MANRLNIAIIGSGGISGTHLPNILKTPELRLVATMDIVEAAAQQREMKSVFGPQNDNDFHRNSLAHSQFHFYSIE